LPDDLFIRDVLVNKILEIEIPLQIEKRRFTMGFQHPEYFVISPIAGGVVQVTYIVIGEGIGKGTLQGICKKDTAMVGNP
jgi:hypothetical protein